MEEARDGQIETQMIRAALSDPIALPLDLYTQCFYIAGFYKQGTLIRPANKIYPVLDSLA